MKVLITIILSVLTSASYGQVKKKYIQQKPLEKKIVYELSNQSIKDLINVCASNCINGNENLNAFAFYKFNLKWGAPRTDAAKAFQNAKYNQWMLDRMFIFFYNSDETWMKTNFLKLGVKAKYCAELSKFLTAKIDEIRNRDSEN